MYSPCRRSMTRLASARSSKTSPGEDMKNRSVFTLRLVWMRPTLLRLRVARLCLRQQVHETRVVPYRVEIRVVLEPEEHAL